jgi:uncharacterized membrane protein YheB (UPF0754 family)
MAKAESVIQAAEKLEPSAKPVFSFKKTKSVIVPLLKMELDIPVYIKSLGAMFVGKEVKSDGIKMEPAILMPVIDLTTGEECQIIINKVVQENLKEVYPNDSYVGKTFEIIKHAKRDGKKYNDFSISEGEV